MCLLHKDLDWKRYINDEVSNRVQYEQALATCSHCLHEYVHLLEGKLETPMPGFIDAIMAAVPGDSRRFKSFKPALHYVVAACLTLAFIELGAFDWIWSRQLAPDPDFFAAMMEGLDTVIGTLKINLGGM